MKKRLCTLCIALLLLLSSCNLEEIYDDDTKIAGEGNAWAVVNYARSIDGGRNTGQAKKCSGMETVWKYSPAVAQDVALTYRLNVDGGRAKLVLVLPDKTVQVLAEDTGEAEGPAAGTVTLHLDEGTHRIKLVGDGANLTWDLSIDAGNWEKD